MPHLLAYVWISDNQRTYRTREIHPTIRHPRRPQRLQQRNSPSPLRPRTSVSLKSPSVVHLSQLTLSSHGWGCPPDLPKAVTYLSAAATNSASIETQALEAGLKKGGAAKGELVLAIYELANCFRNGWGIEKDPVAARLYYETAANLGDTDAMNECAWCYLEGFGGKKDKVLISYLWVLLAVGN